MEEDGFTLVTRKKNKGTRNKSTNGYVNASPVFKASQKNTIINTTKLANIDKLIKSNHFDKKVWDDCPFNSESVVDCVCYGIGSLNSNDTMVQLALLNSLKSNFKNVFIYDPVFSKVEMDYLKEIGYQIIPINEVSDLDILIHRMAREK
ncbi:hypothetical protein BC833DRAFT_446174 [Globomyces pollinis-pini]|nr:hypothetical protein BC833DRAFT_446174 [Globomyces pollinis-pini]